MTPPHLSVGTPVPTTVVCPGAGRPGRSLSLGRRRVRGDRGGGQVSISYVLVAALLLPLLFGIIQYGLWYNAKQALLGAAQTAASIDRAADGAGGITSGTSVATQAGVRNVTLSEQVSATTVTVTAEGDADLIITMPGITHIRQSVSAPVERFTTP